MPSLDPHVRPIAVGNFVSPPFVPELMVQEPVEVFASFFLVPVFVAVGDIGLVFHTQVRGFGCGDAFFDPGIFTKILFMDAAGLYKEVEQFSALSKFSSVHNIPSVQYARRRWCRFVWLLCISPR